MKKNVVMRGQITFFDFIKIPAPSELKSAIHHFNSLDEFDLCYTDYAPSSFDELCGIVDELGRLVKASYDSYADKGLEIVGFKVFHYLVHEGWDAYNYGTDWYIQKKGNTDVAKQVHCCVERLSPTSDSYWHEHDAFTCVASAHTSKRCCGGKALASDRSIFCDKLSDITRVSLEMLGSVNNSTSTTKKESRTISPIQKFIKENDDIVIDDMSNEASVNAKKSESFMKFCKELKSALRKEAKMVGFDDVTLKPNHYDMSGFFKKDDKYVYWSFSAERYGTPTSLKKSGVNGFLYRTAESDKDFRGGNNHFTDLSKLCVEAYSLIS